MITVVYCTRESNPKHFEHIRKSSGLKKIEIIEIVNNGEALTKCYNRGLAQATNDIVVFMHDDIIFETNGWGNKLLKHFNNTGYAILGIAGTTDMADNGRWWQDRKKMVGIVNHTHEGKKWESKYSKSWGNDITDVLVVDGLFFAVNKKRISVNFDENIEGFHFYEIDFVFSNYLAGADVGVIYNIRVTHKSIGATNEEWEKNRLQFVEKFKDNLPEKHVPEFYRTPLTNGTSKVKIRAVIQSSGDLDLFKKLYNDIMKFDYPNLNITLITTDTTYDDFKDLNFDKVKIVEGFYSELPKNLSVLKFEEDFLDKDDELVFFMNDGVEILNNIFLNFAKIYQSNKNEFGCGFPLSYNKDKTIFCSKLDIWVNPENKVAIDMKDNGTYYNVYYGTTNGAVGNLADCIVTTPSLLKMNDWFKLNYETPFYFNDFSLRAFLKNKITFNDTNSLTVQTSFSKQANIQSDFQNIINLIGSEPKLQTIVKKSKV